MASRDVHDSSRQLDELLFRLGQALRRLRVSTGERSSFTYAIGAGFWQLVAISEHGTIRVSDLAGELNLDISTVSRQLKALAQRGLVEKLSDEEDARVARVRLTPEGRKVLDELRQRRHLVLERALAAWDLDRRDTLLELLEDLVRELDVASAQGEEAAGDGGIAETATPPRT